MMGKGYGFYVFEMIFVLVFVWPGASGCERASAGEQRVVEAAGGSVDSLVLGELSEHWTDAAEYLRLSSPVKDTAEVAAVGAGLRYEESAACALVYDFEVTTTTAHEVEKKPAYRNRPQTYQVLGRFELRPEVAAYTQVPVWRLHTRRLGEYVVRNEIRLPGKESKAGDFPDVLLESRGVALELVEGESEVWSRLHAFGGLSEFFPRLSFAGGAEGKVGLRVVEHLSVDEEPAVVLVAVEDEFAARFVVLNSGRLLHAAISRSAEVPTEEGGLIRTQVAEARLTGACEEPTLPPMGYKSSRVRKALDTYTRLVFAVHENQNERAVVNLSQDLIDAHGAETILAMLREHIGQYGIGALGDPSLVEPVEVDGEFLRFRVVGRAENAQGGKEGPVTIINSIVIEEGDQGMRVLSIASTTNQTQYPGKNVSKGLAKDSGGKDSNMLEISPRRIFTASRVKSP